MAFGKLVLGIIMVGLGGLLLAAPLGFLPPGVWPWLLKYWPLLLLSLGLALLANGLKNVVLGVFAAALVVGSLVFAAFWISQHTHAAKTSHESAFDLGKPAVSAITLRGGTLGGSLTLGASTDGKRRQLQVSVRGVPGEEDAAPRWSASGGAGVLVWPGRSGIDLSGAVGGQVTVLAPPRTPVRCDWKSYLSSARADLTRLKPERCDFQAIGSTVKVSVGEAARPSRIVVHGFCSSVEIKLPADCPLRIDFTSLLNMRSFPEDFLEHVSGRSGPKATYWSADGTGRPIQIRIEGPFMRLRVTREPVKAV